MGIYINRFSNVVGVNNRYGVGMGYIHVHVGVLIQEVGMGVVASPALIYQIVLISDVIRRSILITTNYLSCATVPIPGHGRCFGGGWALSGGGM